MSTMGSSRAQGVGIEEMKRRATKAANDLEAHRQLDAAKTELRDRSVLELYDAGCTIKEISQTMHLSPARVMQIVARVG